MDMLFFSLPISSKYFQISLLIPCLINRLFRHILFSFKYLGIFLQILLLVSNLIPSRSENMYVVKLDLLRFVLWFRMWSILVNVLCRLEENVHSAFEQYSEGNGTPLQHSCLENPMDGGAWWAAVHGVAKSWTRLSDFTFTFHFHALEKEMATHSCVLAWRIPGTGEPGGLPSTGSHRVGHNWSDLAAAAAATNENLGILIDNVIDIFYILTIFFSLFCQLLKVLKFLTFQCVFDNSIWTVNCLLQKIK